jgi:nucleoside permease NupC
MLTNSELLALLASGMATVASGVLAAYISFGVSFICYIYKT